MAGPYTSELVGFSKDAAGNTVSVIQIKDSQGGVVKSFPFPSSTAKPADLAVYMQSQITQLEQQDAVFAEFSQLDLSAPTELVLPRDDPDSPLNAFYTAYAILRERLDEQAHGLLAADDASLLKAREDAVALFKPEFKKDPRWFGR